MSAVRTAMRRRPYPRRSRTAVATRAPRPRRPASAGEHGCRRARSDPRRPCTCTAAGRPGPPGVVSPPGPAGSANGCARVERRTISGTRTCTARSGTAGDGVTTSSRSEHRSWCGSEQCRHRGGGGGEHDDLVDERSGHRRGWRRVLRRPRCAEVSAPDAVPARCSGAPASTEVDERGDEQADEQAEAEPADEHRGDEVPVRVREPAPPAGAGEAPREPEAALGAASTVRTIMADTPTVTYPPHGGTWVLHPPSDRTGTATCPPDAGEAARRRTQRPAHHRPRPAERGPAGPGQLRRGSGRSLARSAGRPHLAIARRQHGDQRSARRPRPGHGGRHADARRGRFHRVAGPRLPHGAGARGGTAPVWTVSGSMAPALACRAVRGLRRGLRGTRTPEAPLGPVDPTTSRSPPPATPTRSDRDRPGAYSRTRS
jgi:hypothetical protein